MSRRRQDLLLAIRFVLDMVMVSLAWVLAYATRFSGYFPIPKGVPPFTLYLKLLPFICVIWALVLGTSGFYRRSLRHRSAFIEALDILQSCFMATLGFIAFTYIYAEYRYSRAVMVAFAVIHPVLIITGRSLIRKALRLYRRRAPARRILVIGGGEILESGIRLAMAGDVARADVLGAILVGDAEHRAHGEKLLSHYQLKSLPMPDDWASFCAAQSISTVVLAVPYKVAEVIEAHLDRIADQVPDVRLLPDLARFTRFSAGVDIVGGVPVINMHESPLEGWGSVIKRALDICGAGFGLVLLAPLFVLLAIIIKLSSRGPVFYLQERMGFDGRTFKMYKFRSMPVGVESGTGPVWAQKDDGRPTAVGRWLRRSSLDELPQLFNVIKGDMSLVGPRPERPVFVDEFRRKVPGYFLRHKTKAGMTGWAQVNGWRGNTSLERRIECDLFYIQNWTLWFDLRIILMTVFKSFTDKNAY